MPYPLKIFEIVLMDVSDVDSVRSAVESIGEPIDALVMNAGGMGGKEAVLEILKIDPDAKCVVSSGYALDPIMTNFSDYGFKGAISKPFVVPELLGTLTAIINN